MQEYTTPQKMKRVGDLFSKYKNKLRPPQSTVEKECSAAVKVVTGFTVAAEKITYNTHTKVIYLQVPSLLKTELVFYHERIILEMRKNLHEAEVPKTIL